MIDLPKNWKIYYNSIVDRCRDLIEYKIWGGIDLVQFAKWRKNFESDEEQYFSACVLDALIYRSNQQTFSLIEDILYKNINNLFRTLGQNHINDFPKMMTDDKTDPLIRFVPVLTRDDLVTKSSYEILRFMKRFFFIKEKWIIKPWEIQNEIAKGVEIFIFIDDFLGTGFQFDDVVIDSFLHKTIQEKIIIYAPLVAHEKGIMHLATECPNLKITYSEKFFKSEHSFFDNYFSGKQTIAKKFYLEMLSKRGITVGSDNEYGFGNLEITFAFEHAAPDSSLLILTHRADNWSPLFNH